MKTKLIIQSVCHVIRKSDSVCHVSKYAQSDGLWGILKQFFLQRLNKKNYWDKPENELHYSGKTLLTLKEIIKKPYKQRKKSKNKKEKGY